MQIKTLFQKIMFGLCIFTMSTLIAVGISIIDNFLALILSIVIGSIIITKIIQEPGFGLLFFVFTTGFQNFIIFIPLGGRLSFGMVSGVFVVFGSTINLLIRKRRGTKFHTISWLVIFLVFIAIISVFWSEHLSLYVIKMYRVLLAFILFLTVYISISNLNSIKFIIRHLWKCPGIVNLVTIIGYVIPISGLNLFFSKDYRFSGGMGDPNEYALYNITLLPFIISRCLNKNNNKIENFIAWFFLIISYTAIILTQSRGGIIGATIVTIISLCYLQMHQFGKRLLIFTVVLITLFVILISLNPFVFHRFLSVDEMIVVDARPSLFLIGLSIIKDNPLLGVGLGNSFDPRLVDFYQRHTQVYRNINAQGNFHNGFIQIGVELGVVGLLVYLLIILFSIYKLKQLSKIPFIRSYPKINKFIRSLHISFLGFSTGILFLGEEFAKIFWAILIISCAIVQLFSSSHQLLSKSHIITRKNL